MLAIVLLNNGFFCQFDTLKHNSMGDWVQIWTVFCWAAWLIWCFLEISFRFICFVKLFTFVLYCVHRKMKSLSYGCGVTKRWSPWVHDLGAEGQILLFITGVDCAECRKYYFYRWSHVWRIVERIVLVNSVGIHRSSLFLAWIWKVQWLMLSDYNTIQTKIILCPSRPHLSHRRKQFYISQDCITSQKKTVLYLSRLHISHIFGTAFINCCGYWC